MWVAQASGGRPRAPAKKVKQPSKTCSEVKPADAGRLNVKHFLFHAPGRGMHLDVSTEKRRKRLFRSLQLPLRRGTRGASGPGGLVERRDLVDGLKVK